MVRAADS